MENPKGKKTNLKMGEKMFATKFRNKQFISKTCKQFIQLNTYIYITYIYIKQSTNRIWAKDRNGHLSKESIQMDIKHMKRCPGSLLVKCHSKLQWGVNLPLSEWPSSKSESINHSVCLTLCNPIDCSLPGSSVHGNSLGKNTRMGCRFLLQGIFPT